MKKQKRKENKKKYNNKIEKLNEKLKNCNKENDQLYYKIVS